MRHFVAILLAGGALALACADVTLTFPSPGAHTITVIGADGSPSTTAAEGRTASIPDVKGARTVQVVDARGNLASRPASEVAAGKTQFQPKDFARVAAVEVLVQSGGAPIAAASVTLDDGTPATQLIAPDQQKPGTARFENVKPGRLRVKVVYSIGGKAAEPVEQAFSVALERDAAVPLLKIAVPEAAATVPAGPGAAATDRTPAKAQPGPNPFGSFLVYLLGIGVAAGIAYLVWKYALQNPDKVLPKLEQLGVQVPKAGVDPMSEADPAPLPMPVSPALIPKIVLDGAAPDPMPTAVPAAPFAPRLVSDSGQSIELGEGESVVGREAGTPIALVGEPTVSRQHAALRRVGDRVVVVDLGSTNGTYVNGVKVSSEQELRVGDQVQFGAVRFRFEA